MKFITYTLAAFSTIAIATPVKRNHDYMATVDYYRRAAGLPLLQYDSALEYYAQKAAIDSGGHDAIHEFPPGNGPKAQVIGPQCCGWNDFTRVYLNMLCEHPTAPYLQGKCNNVPEYGGDTGHYDILTSRTYTKIGCAFWGGHTGATTGLWYCDLGT